MDGSDADTSMEQYARAHGLLDRLEERLALSPVRRPLIARIKLAELEALSWTDDLPFGDGDIQIDRRGRIGFSEFNLMHWRSALSGEISLKELKENPEAVVRWLGGELDPSLLMHGRSIGDLCAAISVWMDHCRALPPSPPLLRSAQISKLWRDFSPMAQGDRLASLLIGDRWGPGRWNGTTGGLIALGLRVGQAPWRQAQGSALNAIWLQAICAGVHHHLDLETALRAYAVRVTHQLADRKRAESLKRLLLLAMSRPHISSGLVAQALRITSAGAIKLLGTAEQLGLLIERSGQASYRSYMVPVTSNRPPSPTPAPFEPDFWATTTEIEGDF